eukprot:Phypoly_transcript_03095.p1 GENE.Phypoly_transcript_03095~~Phypoly_transcript_03095.p1  ORF type:complete len:841 (+),score=168.35 Phypoly_transcript_03095:323-2524(+)
MKSLVYENYNKFISATDTIRKMKSNVENMEAEMSRLSRDMQQITECSNKIDAALAPRQEKIEQLSGVHNLLQKLQFLVGLPARLRKCIELEAYGQAVKYFTITTGILSQYNHLPSFKSIHSECEKIIQEMREKLRVKISDPKTQPSEVSEVADFLIELSEPIPSLRELYLKSRRSALEALLSSFESRESPSLIGAITELSQMFLIELMYTLQSYRSLFMNRFDETKLNKKDKDESAKLLVDFAKSLFKHFLAVSGNKLSSSNATPDEQIKGLEVLTYEVMKVNAKLPELSAGDKIGDIINSTVQKQISAYFSKLESTINSQLTTINATIDKTATDVATFTQLCETSSKMIIKEVAETCEKVKGFFTKASETTLLNNYYGVLFQKMEVKVQQFFLSLSIMMLDYIDPEKDKKESKNLKPKESRARFLLLLTYICLFMEGKGLSQVMSLMQDIVTNVKKAVGGAATDVQINVLNAPELAQRIRETAQKLLKQYVALEGQRTGTMLRQGIEKMPSWVKKEPREVRLVIDIVVESITNNAKDIDAVFALPGSSLSSSSSSTAPITSSSSLSTSTLSASSLSSNPSPSPSAQGPRHARATSNTTSGLAAAQTVTVMPKSSSVPGNMTLFDKKVDVFGPIEFTANSVLGAIVKIGLKTMLECVRLRTFSRNGYQQIQVDIHFLRLILWSFLGKNGPVDVLLSEVEQSVAERCTEPTKLEASIVAKLCEDKMQKGPSPNQ